MNKGCETGPPAYRPYPRADQQRYFKGKCYICGHDLCLSCNGIKEISVTWKGQRLFVLCFFT